MSGFSGVAWLQHVMLLPWALCFYTRLGIRTMMPLWSILLSVLSAWRWNRLSIRSAHNILIHLSSSFRYYSCVIANYIQFLFALSCLPQLITLGPHVHWSQALGQSKAAIGLCHHCNCISICPSWNNIPNSILWRLFVGCGLEGWESPFNSKVWE